MSEWYASLQGLWQASWALMAGRDGAAYATLATIGAGGGPQARLLMLRGADAGAAELTLHTDATTSKVAELRENPNAALHFWSRSQDLQLRCTGSATVKTGPELQSLWDSLPPHNRTNYGVTPAPGSDIARPDAYQRAPNFDQFAVISLVAEHIDIVHLSPDFHRRARYTRADGWAGQWCAP